MTFRGDDDDYEYVDDDDFYGKDDDDDDDEELGGDWRNRLGSRSSTLPGRDRSSGFSSSSPGSNPNPNRSSVYGNKSDNPSSSDSRSKSSPFSSGSNPPNRPTGSTYNSGTTRDKFSDRVTRSGDTGQLRNPSSPTNSPGGKDWRSSTANKPSSSTSSTSSSSSSDVNSNWRSQLSKSDSGDDRSDSKSTSRFNVGIKSDDKKDDKKSDKKADGGTSKRFGGLTNRFGGNKDTQKDIKKDDRKPFGSDKKADSGTSKRFGGLTNRFGGNKDTQKDDKKADSGTSNRFGSDKKADSGTSKRFGGLSNRLGGNKNAPKHNKQDDKRTTGSNKTVDSSKSVSAVAGGITSRFGGLSNRFGGNKDTQKDDKQDDKRTTGSNKNTDSRFRNRDSSSSSSKQSAFGSAKSSGTTSTTKTTKSTSEEKSGGGLFGNLFNRGKSDDKASKPAPKARTSKVPKVESDEWFDLDRKLDLVGVGLFFGAILMLVSALSQEQAAISFIHKAIGEMFGWGALAVPFSMAAVGLWLMVRSFGDSAPTINPVRLGGVVIGFFALLTLFQYVDSFNYIEVIPKALNTRIAECSAEFQSSCTEEIQSLSECQVAITPACLDGLVKYSYGQGKGGGIVGGWLYLTLYNSITEIGGFVVVVMALTFAVMLITHLSMAEIAVVFIGVSRGIRGSMAKNAAKRRAQRLRAEQQKALAAQSNSVTVSTPAPAQLPGFAMVGALPEPAENGDSPIPIEERDILIRRGGQAFSSTELEQQPVLLGTMGQPQLQVQPQSSGGMLGKLFNRNKPQPQPQPIQPQVATASTAVAATATAGLMGKLLNRGDQNDQPVQQPQQPQPNSMPNPVHPTTLPGGSVLQPHVQPQQPITQPQQQPAVAFDSTAQTRQPVQQPQQPAQQPITQPQQPQPVQQSDTVALRQDRLNAIRSGMTAPQPQPQVQQPVASNGGNGNDYNPFGRPDDIPTHETEDLPGRSFSTTTPVTTYSQPTRQVNPLINPQQNSVQKPVSSGPVNQSKPRVNWKLPDFRTLLSSGSEQEFDRESLLNQARIIEETLASFGAPGRVVEVNTGPVITQYGVEPDYLTARSGKKSRVKVSAIAQLDKDMQLALGAKTIRVEAPVPGKGYVGIEVPNSEASLVSLRDVMESEGFQKIKSPLAIALGMSVDGTPISADLTSMPHLLIAGTTGSGKSVCVNAIINSIIATSSPEQVKFVMIDPKRVELTGYNGVPHLIAPVVVELERIVGVLKWVTREMDERYKKFSNAGARNIVDYNKHRDPNLEMMPYIIVIIDELADLMMLAPEDTERTITRIAALARATGIHLVIATQRPSVDVVTGLIKANFPARIAFAVAGGVDSRVILDQPGAERLLGKGDMLYLSGDSPSAQRLQGVFVSDIEISNISRYWKMQSAGIDEIKPISILSSSVAPEQAQYVAPTADRARQAAFWDNSSVSEPDDPQQLAVEDKTGNPDPQEDELYETAVQMVRRLDKASISLLQRRLRIGYTRAARLIDMMEERGVVGPSKEGSSKPRDVIVE
jgi:DNA segregation ATPase FtsK/SpoIIIE-like protein